MCLIEHVLYCRVIVVRVRSRGRVGEERRRVQELHVGLDCGLVEVMGLGLITCGEGEDVVGVHTLLSGVLQVCHELLVGEEEEKEEEQGRQEEKEAKGEGQSEETHVDDHGYGDGTNGENLSHGACVWMKSR